MKLLLVEDDVLLSAALTKMLGTNCYTIDVAQDGEAGLQLATTVDYDLVLLDVQLPKLSGMTVCRQLRSQGYRKPILLMTAHDTDAEAVAGFEAGADDYIHKPCAEEVLLARIRTWLRRSGAGEPTLARSTPTPTLTWGNLSLDLESGRVMVGSEVVTLTAKEYNLLELFLRHPDRIFSRSAILDQLWGFDDVPTDRAIVTHVKDLRKKLKAGGLTDELIETVYGMGYRLKPAKPTTSNGSGSPPAATVTALTTAQQSAARVLARFRGVLDQQVAVLARAKTALLAGNLPPDLQQAALQEAHKLAGSLATLGYPNGSKLARSLEHWLIGVTIPPDSPATPFTSAAIAHFVDLVTALQREVNQAPAASRPTVPVRSTQVLVIDDDQVLTQQLQAEATAQALQVHIAPDLAAARSHLATERPDVVLLDLSFPAVEEDGLTLLRELTEQDPKLPVIVFTGRDSLMDRLAVCRLGARQFLQKPASTEQIFRAINHAIAPPPTPEAKVLMVDDDPTLLASLAEMLTPWGLEVTVLSDPQRFWDVLVTIAPDLILLDLEMPGIHGLELCQVVRQDAQWGDLPILVVTAHTEADALQQAFAVGADDFITKPVLGPELVTRVISRIHRLRFRSRSKPLPPAFQGGHE